MNLSLKPDVQKIIHDRVESGQYPTPEDVVTAAVKALDQQDGFGDFASGELDELLADGESSIEEHGTLDGEEAYRARCERRTEKRKSSCNYRISRMANRDIERICASISEGNPDAADRLDQQFHQAIQLLAEFPGLGHKSQAC